MLLRFKGWFTALSLLAKTGVVAAAVTTGAVVDHQINKNTPADVKGTSIRCTSTITYPTETQPVPFDKTTVDDPNTEKGKTYIDPAGVDGQKTITYKATSYSPSGCNQDSKVFLKDEVTAQPVTEVTHVGTYVAPPPVENCTPGYSPCIPPGPDVDCAGGTGNSPRYVTGPVYVTGLDIYGLDRDGNGIGCQ